MALVVKNPLANAGDTRDADSIPGSEKFPVEGNGNPLQYSCLEIPWTEEPRRPESMVHKESHKNVHTPIYTKNTVCIYQIYTEFSEKVMAPHSSTLAWKIPWMEEPGRLQSMGSLRVGHD